MLGGYYSINLISQTILSVCKGWSYKAYEIYRYQIFNKTVELWSFLYGKMWFSEIFEDFTEEAKNAYIF